MEYNRGTVADLFQEEGEIMFVCESDREYELHSGNTELNDDYMEGRGLKEIDGEKQYVDVVLPYECIEHHFTHKQL